MGSGCKKAEATSSSSRTWTRAAPEYFMMLYCRMALIDVLVCSN